MSEQREAAGKLALRGWILFYHDLDPAIPEVPEILRFQESAAAMGIALSTLKPQKFELVVGSEADWQIRYDGRDVERPDFVICRTGAETDYPTLALLRHLERGGVRLINGPETVELVADKLHTLQKLAQAGLPVPRTMLGVFPIDPMIVEQELGFPVIVKTLKGTRGAGVLKCENRAQFEDLAGLLQSAGTSVDFIMQHYIRASHGRDVRVLVVGGRVIAAMERRSLTGGFKSNVSLGGTGEAYNPPREMAELAVRAAETLGLDVTGIDILFDDEGYRICEANSAPGFQGLERACAIDVPAAILGWVSHTQGVDLRQAKSEEDDVLLDVVFRGRTGLRDIADRSPGYRQFAGQIALQLTIAGLVSLLHALLPSGIVDGKGRVGAGLRTLFEGRRFDQSRLNVLEEERVLFVSLAVSIWAAILPWLAGAPAAFAGMISLIALCFPLLFLFTAPAGRAGLSIDRRRRAEK
ncbi:ATP-grasp domain-containing protein [Sphingomonas sp.]|uniref:ATP-grasp domain-containing protein n=1 Tax=Sphingomonas sp. TaxID=28214 RepID=UPI003F71681D